jgi:hypothetical protein
MSKCVKNNFVLLKFITECTQKLQKIILKSVSKDFIFAISECCTNFLRGNIAVQINVIEALTKYKKHIRALSSKQLSLQEKKQILSTKGYLFLKPLLKPIITGLQQYWGRKNEVCQKNGSS